RWRSPPRRGARRSGGTRVSRRRRSSPGPRCWWSRWPRARRCSPRPPRGVSPVLRRPPRRRPSSETLPFATVGGPAVHNGGPIRSLVHHVQRVEPLAELPRLGVTPPRPLADRHGAAHRRLDLARALPAEIAQAGRGGGDGQSTRPGHAGGHVAAIEEGGEPPGGSPDRRQGEEQGRTGGETPVVIEQA